MRDEDKSKQQLINELVQLREKYKKVQNELNTSKTIVEELKYEKNRFQTLLSLIPIGVSYVTDISCREIIHNPISAQFLRINEWESLSHSGPKVLQLKVYRHGQRLSPKEMPIQRSAWFGETFNGDELEFVWEDGVRKYSLWNSCPLKNELGDTVGVLATCTDITQRRLIDDGIKEHQKLELEKSNRLMKDILDSAVDCYLVFDKEWRYVDISEKALPFIETEKEKVIGKVVWEASPQLTNSKIYEIFHDAVEKQKSIYFETRGKFNTDTYFEACVYPIEIGLLVCFKDMTERKKMQQEIARLDRLNLIGQMASSIAHEVRNPLTSVRGFLQLMASKEKDPRNNEYYDLIIEELDRANSIITEFLSLARDMKVTMKLVSLNSIINAIYPILSTDALKQDKRIVLKEGDIPNISVNEKEIRQLVLNLVRNGLEAMPSGTKLTIGTYLDNDDVVLYVQDEGSGIEVEVLEKLGTPFVTTKDNGTGLGLAVCYSIAERHTAKIDIETGTFGTTFYVRFKIPQIETEHVS